MLCANPQYLRTQRRLFVSISTPMSEKKCKGPASHTTITIHPPVVPVPRCFAAEDSNMQFLFAASGYQLVVSSTHPSKSRNKPPMAAVAVQTSRTRRPPPHGSPAHCPLAHPVTWADGAMLGLFRHSGPEKFLSSPSQPTFGHPGGRVAYLGKAYRPSHRCSSQLSSHIPNTLQ